MNEPRIGYIYNAQDYFEFDIIPSLTIFLYRSIPRGTLNEVDSFILREQGQVPR